MRTTFIIGLFLFSALANNQKTFGQTKQQKTPIPNVVGMLYKDSKKYLKSKGFNIGAIVPDSDINIDQNFDSSIVYKQYPSSKNDKGTQNFAGKEHLIDIYLSRPEHIIDSSEIILRRKKF